ncbi:MAG: ImmA/IrrE family metallo-endopeptidase, partial [Hymenobacter sp.]
VIVLNETDTPERRRFTALHELGHLVLKISAADDKESESFCHRFASAMLLPQEVVWREFGQTRKRISDYELKAVKKQYGISAQAIMRRLFDLSVINQSYYRYFCIKVAADRKETKFGEFQGERTKSYRFEQLIHRLVAEDLISDARAASLAGITLRAFRKQLNPDGE